MDRHTSSTTTTRVICRAAPEHTVISKTRPFSIMGFYTLSFLLKMEIDIHHDILLKQFTKEIIYECSKFLSRHPNANHFQKNNFCFNHKTLKKKA